MKCFARYVPTVEITNIMDGFTAGLIIPELQSVVELGLGLPCAEGFGSGNVCTDNNGVKVGHCNSDLICGGENAMCYPDQNKLCANGLICDPVLETCIQQDVEVCNDEMDNDLDGFIDCDQEYCAGAQVCYPNTNEPCRTNTDCPSETICENPNVGSCTGVESAVEQCTTNDDCLSGYGCLENKCVKNCIVGVGVGQITSICDNDNGCASGLKCIQGSCDYDVEGQTWMQECNDIGLFCKLPLICISTDQGNYCDYSGDGATLGLGCDLTIVPPVICRDGLDCADGLIGDTCVIPAATYLDSSLCDQGYNCVTDVN